MGFFLLYLRQSHANSTGWGCRMLHGKWNNRPKVELPYKPSPDCVVIVTTLKGFFAFFAFFASFVLFLTALLQL